MRIVQILLVLVFLAVAGVYTVQDMSGRLSTADDPPVLSCDSETLEISVKADDDDLRRGITAQDPQDGDISDRVLISGISRLIDDSTAKITYVVFDSDANMATLTRFVRYTDYRLPRFSLEEPLVYAAGESMVILDRLHAEDVLDGDITKAIRVTYGDSAAESGIYEMTVQVTNSMGDTAWQKLPVIMVDDVDNWINVTLDTYLVYLNRGGSFQARSYLKGADLGGASISLDNVSVEGKVDTETPGTYMVRYTCTYGSRTGTAILTVVVE